MFFVEGGEFAMLEKIKGFVQKHKTKAIVAVGSASTAMAAMAPVAFADDQQAGIVTNPVGTLDMWASITGGVGTFVNGILMPVASFCTSNGICLMFLTATFIKLGVGVLKRSISAFGRGR